MVVKSSHIHKLKRVKYKSGNSVFFCALPDCNFKINPSLALGKRCICWRCGEPFIMSEYSLRLAKPHCEGCHKSKNDKIEVVEPLTTALPPEFITAGVGKHISLAERLQQTIQQKQKESEEEI